MCLSVSHHVETSDCCLLVEMDRGKKLKRVCEMQHFVHNLNKWNVCSWSLISGLAVFSQSSAHSHLRQLPRSVSAHLSVSCAFWPLSILTLSVSSVRGAGCHGFIGIGGCFQLANPAWRSSNPEMNALHARRSCPEFTSVHSQARRLQPGSESELSVCLYLSVCTCEHQDSPDTWMWRCMNDPCDLQDSCLWVSPSERWFCCDCFWLYSKYSTVYSTSLLWDITVVHNHWPCYTYKTHCLCYKHECDILLRSDVYFTLWFSSDGRSRGKHVKHSIALATTQIILSSWQPPVTSEKQYF